MPNPTPAQPPTILLVDDEEQILFSSSLTLKRHGFPRILTLSEAAPVIPTLEQEEISLVVLDLCMPDISGQDLLQQISYRFPHIPVIVMTAVAELETAVACMQSGAFDYLTKPMKQEPFLASVRRALEVADLKRENLSLKRRLLAGAVENEAAFAEILTVDRRMRAIFQYMEAVAGGSEPLLITGETGVGKELIARAVHRLSRRSGSLVAVNAAGLDDTVFSDTLFGHRRGAFTGAMEERDGLIVRAGGGTLFLDEVGDLEAKSQVKLLRLLQEREYYPLGADLPKKTDARLIVATNRDLRRMVETGGFRNDLYYRLCSHHIHIPPLRRRRDDLPLLVDRFLTDAAQAAGREKPSVPPQLFTLLANYDFPGNIRELQGMVSDAVIRHRGGVLSLESFRTAMHPGAAELSAPPGDDAPPFPPFEQRLPTLEEAKDYLVTEALKRAEGNQGIAAGMLGITRQALNRRLHKASREKG